MVSAPWLSLDLFISLDQIVIALCNITRVHLGCTACIRLTNYAVSNVDSDCILGKSSCPGDGVLGPRNIMSKRSSDVRTRTCRLHKLSNVVTLLLTASTIRGTCA